MLTKRNKKGGIIGYVNETRKDVKRMFQKNEFMAELVRRNLTVSSVAKNAGMNTATLHRKMNGESDFYRGEIEKIIQFLGLTGADVLRIFLPKRLRKRNRRRKMKVMTIANTSINELVEI